jgi:hypothetical protein
MEVLLQIPFASTTDHQHQEKDDLMSSRMHCVIHPQTHFSIEDTETCFDWRLIPLEIRHQTSTLTTCSVLCKQRLNLIDQLFPNITAIIFNRGVLVHEDQLLVKQWLDHRDASSSTIVHAEKQPMKKIIKIRIQGNDHVDPKYERKENPEFAASDKKPHLPSYITAFSSRVKTLPFLLYSEHLTAMDIYHCDHLTTIDNLVKLKSATIAYCESFKHVGHNLPLLNHLTIKSCDEFDGRISCPALTHLTLDTIRVRQISCVVNDDTDMYRNNRNISLKSVLKHITLNQFWNVKNERSCLPRIHFCRVRPSSRISNDYLDQYHPATDLMFDILDHCVVDKLTLYNCDLGKFINDKTYLHFNVNALHMTNCTSHNSIEPIVSKAHKQIHMINHDHKPYTTTLSAQWLQKTLEKFVIGVGNQHSVMYTVKNRKNKNCFQLIKMVADLNINWHGYMDMDLDRMPGNDNNVILFDVADIPYLHIYLLRR